MRIAIKRQNFLQLFKIRQLFQILSMKESKNKNQLSLNQYQINISHSQLTSVRDIKHSQASNIKKLTIMHCCLLSLKGIEDFTSLQTLNLKYNNLEDATQILLIRNKHLLLELIIQGNPIEYYALCTYASLRANGFINLQSLNNKDYTKWLKSKKKTPTSKNINNQLNKIEKSMSKTLKRVFKNNITQKYRLAPQIQQDQQIQKDANEDLCRQNQVTSRYAQKIQYGSSFKVIEGSTERIPLKEISLSNVNLVKSIKPEINEAKGIPQLIIEPIAFSQNQISHMPLTQPTATFASQKHKQNKTFRSRNNCKSFINMVYEDDQQCFTNQNQQISEIQQSYSQRPSYSILARSALDNKSYYTQDIRQNIDEQMYAMAIACRAKYLLNAAFNSLKPINLPLSRDNF